MGGRLVPDLSFEPAAIHFLHRALAAITGVVVFAVGIGIARRKTEIPVQARFAQAAMGLFGLQILIGAANVWNPPPGIVNELFVTAHLLLAALIWGCLVAATAVSLPSVATHRSRTRVRTHAAYESGA
jgi:heme A synthase